MAAHGSATQLHALIRYHCGGKGGADAGIGLGRQKTDQVAAMPAGQTRRKGLPPTAPPPENNQRLRHQLIPTMHCTQRFSPFSIQDTMP